MKQIKILGTGCKSCVSLENNTREAVNNIGMDAEISKVTDMASILGFGVMKTPALVVDEKVIVSGRVPTVKEIEELL